MKRKNFIKTEIIRVRTRVAVGQLVKVSPWLHKIRLPLPFGYAIATRQHWRQP